MATPNITQAQVLALVTAVIGLIVSQGLVSNDNGQKIIGIAAIAIPIVIALADAFIRHGRAKVAAVQAAQPVEVGIPSDALLAAQLDDPDPDLLEDLPEEAPVTERRPAGTPPSPPPG